MVDFNNEEFIKEFKKNAVGFLARNGNFNVPEARNEIKMIEERIGFPVFFAAMGKDIRFVNIEYIRLNRVGATIALNRRERIGVATLLENAMRHAAMVVFKD